MPKLTLDALLALAQEAVAEDREYRTKNGTVTWDDRRVGRMLAREPALAQAVIDLLGEAFPCGFVPPSTEDPRTVVILDGSNDPQPAYEFTPTEARAYAAALLRAADEAQGESHG